MNTLPYEVVVGQDPNKIRTQMQLSDEQLTGILVGESILDNPAWTNLYVMNPNTMYKDPEILANDDIFHQEPFNQYVIAYIDNLNDFANLVKNQGLGGAILMGNLTHPREIANRKKTRIITDNNVTKPYVAVLEPASDPNTGMLIQFDSPEFLQGFASTCRWLNAQNCKGSVEYLFYKGQPVDVEF